MEPTLLDLLRVQRELAEKRLPPDQQDAYVRAQFGDAVPSVAALVTRVQGSQRMARAQIGTRRTDPDIHATPSAQILRTAQRGLVAGETVEAVNAYIRQRTGNDTLTIDGLEQLVGQERTGPTMKQVGAGLAQGASLGVARRVLPAGFGETLDSYRREYPALAMVTEGAGSMAIPGLGEFAAAKTLGRPLGLLGQMGINAAAGGTQMAMEGEPGKEGMNTLLGAGAGAGASLVAPVAGRVMSGLLREGATVAAPEMMARRQAQQLVGQAARSEGGPEMVAQQFNEMHAQRPGAVMLADAAPAMQQELEFAAQSPAVRPGLRAALRSRAQGAGQRTTDDLLQLTGGSGRARALLASEEETLASWATPAYNELREKNIAIASPQITQLIETRPALQQAWADGQRIAANRGQGLVPIVEQDATGAWRATGKFPDFSTVQYMKQALDGRVNSLYLAGHSAEASSLAALRDEFYGEAINAVEGYGAVQGQYAEAMRRQRALEQGLSFLRDDPETIRRTLGKMKSIEERSAYLDAAGTSVADLVRRMNRNRDVRNIFNSTAMDERLRLLFPDTDDGERMFQHWLSGLETEGTMSETRALASGNSATKSRQELATQRRLQMRGPLSAFLSGVQTGGSVRAGAASVLRQELERAAVNLTPHEQRVMNYLAQQLQSATPEAVERILKQGERAFAAGVRWEKVGAAFRQAATAATRQGAVETFSPVRGPYAPEYVDAGLAIPYDPALSRRP